MSFKQIKWVRITSSVLSILLFFTNIIAALMRLFFFNLKGDKDYKENICFLAPFVRGILFMCYIKFVFLCYWGIELKGVSSKRRYH